MLPGWGKRYHVWRFPTTRGEVGKSFQIMKKKLILKKKMAKSVYHLAEIKILVYPLKIQYIIEY